MHRSSRNVLITGFWVLLSIAVFGYSYFQVVRKSWSIPMALLLSLAAGVVSVLAIMKAVQANNRALDEKEARDKNRNA